MKILYLLPSYNLFGGTPKKTLDLVTYSKNENYLYVWSQQHIKFKQEFLNKNVVVYDSSYGRNLYMHLKILLKIVDTYKIEIIQSQFFFGELLASLVKILRPKLKIIIAFVGSKSPSRPKRAILNFLYRKTDAFVYISKYVKREREKMLPRLKKGYSIIIYNGTDQKEQPKKIKKNKIFNVLCISGLTKIKNVQILIDCMVLLLEKGQKNIKIIVAGDGPEKQNFENQIKSKNLSNNFKLLGYQKKVNHLLEEADLFVHPCYIEGFGIAVAEAMMAQKPIVVSNAGALPELIKHKSTGLVIPPFDSESWCNAILTLKNNKYLANTLSCNAKLFAENNFSISQFVSNYNSLYNKLLNS